jgi:hypothetical protein
MNDTETLRNLFKPRVYVNMTTNAHGKYEVTLEEPLQPDSSVKICRLPGDTVIVNVDLFEGPNHVFNCDTGICKRADYAIISESRRSVLYVELKSGSYGQCDVVKQLIGAKCFISYCREVVRQFWGNPSFMEGYCERFVSFVHVSASQRPISEPSRAIHDCPTNFMKIKHPNRNFQHFNRLIGRV